MFRDGQNGLIPFFLIDSSKTSLKSVLLHNGNGLASIPVGRVVHMKETYENMIQCFRCINYDHYYWQLGGDMKVLALLLCQQTGHSRYCSFLYELDSRASQSNYIISD